ncbi:hypothetical protein [Streptomyces sp. G45]|uniref:hypothetical protein n=1 Tax=Streptomyces sp. G45 TaxID=3406627 RepID=UPI003C18259B
MLRSQKPVKRRLTVLVPAVLALLLGVTGPVAARSAAASEPVTTTSTFQASGEPEEYNSQA